MSTRPPTLTEILHHDSSPPWTLSAFTAYLSQNHCMESLEFIIDLQRYAVIHEQIRNDKSPDPTANEQLYVRWEELMQVYIHPSSPREINVPSRVRDRLLRLPRKPNPPHPRELEEAGRIVYELMDDSLLVPFLKSVTPINLGDLPLDDIDGPPKYPPYLDASESTSSSRSGSNHALDSEVLTDTSDGRSLQLTELMGMATISSMDWANASWSRLQRAMAAHSNGWKVVGAKLRFNRKRSTKRATPTS